MNKQLEIENKVFNRYYKKWIKKYPSKFVLIKTDKVIGFFDTLDIAFKEGTKRFGLKDFFVKQIIPTDINNVSFFGKNYLLVS